MRSDGRERSGENESRLCVLMYVRRITTHPFVSCLSSFLQMAYFELKDYRRALDSFQYLLRKHPYHGEYLRQAAACYSHLKKPQSGVTLILGYVEWFKEEVEKGERERGGSSSSASDQQLQALKKQRSNSGTAVDASSSSSTPPHLTRSDLDIDLVNIMCELLLSLRKYQEVVDALEDLLPYLMETLRKNDPARSRQLQEKPPEEQVLTLPFDLGSKLGMAHLYLKDYSLAEQLFAPIFAVESPYDVENWGDLYVEIAEAYVNNKIYPQAEKLLTSVLHAPLQPGQSTGTWAHLEGKIVFLQARCAHYQALAQLHASWANPALSSTSTTATAHGEQMLKALNLYEKVHVAEEGKNVGQCSQKAREHCIAEHVPGLIADSLSPSVPPQMLVWRCRSFSPCSVIAPALWPSSLVWT
jgi:tetratricopeptide (TPR) repeat protein